MVILQALCEEALVIDTEALGRALDDPVSPWNLTNVWETDKYAESWAEWTTEPSESNFGSAEVTTSSARGSAGRMPGTTEPPPAPAIVVPRQSSCGGAKRGFFRLGHGVYLCWACYLSFGLG
jgi:hypothetical protein